MPADRKQRRRVIDHLQAFRIIGLANGDKRNVELSRGVDLTLGCVARTNLRRSPPPAPRQRGQGLKRGTGAAEVIDKGAKSPRPDILAADEAQPVEPLFVGEVDSFCALVHSSPNTVRQSRLAIENSYVVRAIIRRI